MDRAVGFARGCAEWVRVRVSSIVAEDAGLGLFVALPLGTGAADLIKGCSDYGIDGHGTPVVKRGTFVGFYRGEWMRRSTTRSYRGARKSHAMETDDFFIVPPRAAAAADATLVNVYEYRIAAVQEVPVR